MNERFNDIPERYVWEDRSDPIKGLDQTNEQKWEIPDSIMVKAAVVGGSIKRETNPNRPYTPDEIRKSATECIDAGAIVYTFIHDFRTAKVYLILMNTPAHAPYRGANKRKIWQQSDNRRLLPRADF